MIGAGGFDSPDLRDPVRREDAEWAMRRIITAGLAVVESGVEEDAVRALVVEEGMGEDLAHRFFMRFRTAIAAMAEALGGGEDLGDVPDRFAAALRRDRV